MSAMGAGVNGGPLTAGRLRSIDHIAHSPDLEPLEVVDLSDFDQNGRAVSDHFGVAVRLARTSLSTLPEAAAAVPPFPLKPLDLRCD